MGNKHLISNVDSEFITVDAVLQSGAHTCGVDAFSLALIKVERQLRRLFTHLIFQFPCFSSSDIGILRKTLSDFRSVYFEGLEKGFNALYPVPIANIVGKEHDKLRLRVREAHSHRNKIFHGQLTEHGLSRKNLIDLENDLRSWCEELAKGAQAVIGYDGFARDSFQKSKKPNIADCYLVKFNNVEDYRIFIKQYMARKS